MTFTSIDFETATPARSSICQIRICRVENGLIVYKDCFLVQPPDNEYTHWNVMVHGISPDQTKNHPTFPEIWDKIKDYLAGQLVIAAFDRSCLTQALELYGIAEPSLTWACTYEAIGLSLIDLVETLEITLLEHHDALNDAHMYAEAYLKLQIGVVPDPNRISSKLAKPQFVGNFKLTGDVLRPNLQNVDPTNNFLT